jgi:hypothetical protein
LCLSSGSFTELLFTGNMCWCGTSGLFTELLFTGTMCLFGTSGLFTGLLFAGNICLFGCISSFTELLLSQETYVCMGVVLHFWSCYYLMNHVFLWYQFFIYGDAIHRKHVLVWEYG